ncbi:MAG: NAD(P)/FAD-dependent oxidoreductase, partial [Bacteroidota bacterium]
MNQLPRRDFLRMLAGAFSATAIDWNVFPVGHSASDDAAAYDAIIIGAGLGGLSCAAAFARQGFKPLVVEQHDKPGGFATAFSRPGGFLFDVSLHSTTIGQRDGLYNLLQGFPEITDIEYIPHPTLFRAKYPDYDIRAAQQNPKAFIETLIRLFPEEKEGIAGLFDDMTGLARDIGRLSEAKGQVDMSQFPSEFPHLFRYHTATWETMMDARIHSPKLKAIVSAQWGYYGLPPSKLSSFYYALPFLGYLTHGGFYPKGRSQDISDALVRIIRKQGGTVMLNTTVEKILMKDGAASGVATADGKQYAARVVVSNANPFDTFRKMISDRAALTECEASWQNYSVSLSCFQVFLGLKSDLVSKLGITDSEIFVAPSYDPDAEYAGALRGEVDRSGFGISLYDNIYRGYSPAGKNTINIMTLQGYTPWEQFEADYFAGKKSEYVKEKERRA